MTNERTIQTNCTIRKPGDPEPEAVAKSQTKPKAKRAAKRKVPKRKTETADEGNIVRGEE